jgi:hypothetical protein
METSTDTLVLVVTGLALILAVIASALAIGALAAFRRFGERRILFVGLAFLTIAATSALAFLSESGLAGSVLGDETFSFEPAPSFLLLLTLFLVCLALIRGRGAAPEADRGRR